MQINYFLSCAFFSLGVFSLYYWSFSMGLLEHASLFMNMEIPFSFLAAPSFYLYFSTITGVREYRTSSILLRLIPFILSFLLIIILNLTDPSLREYYVSHPRMFPDYSANRFIHVINTICDGYVLFYIFAGLYKISILFRIKKITREVRFVIMYLVIFFLAVLLLLLADIVNINILTLIGLLLILILPVCHMLFSFRYPEFTMRVIKEARNERYRMSMKKEMSAKLVEERLEQLMKDEKVFINPELTLTLLSEKLMISQRMLSTIINDRYGMNFNSFINAHRIGEAKKQLMSEPDKGILEIALSCGFNSSSSFYTYFKRVTNMSPHEYVLTAEK